MSTIATTNFKVLSAKGFIGNVQNDDNSVYAFFGRSQPWDNEDIGASPDIPLDYQYDYFAADRDIIALKKINAANVCHVIPRKNWSPYNFYDQWDDKDESIWEKDFYVMNSDYVIYKCLRAPINRTTGERIASTEEPTHVPPYDTNGFIDLTDDPKQYDDGYIWKFMYKLSELDMKFLTFDFMPIRYYNPNGTYVGLTETEQLNLDVQEASFGRVGDIYSYVVESGGSGYTTGDEPVITIAGDGTGADVNVYIGSDGTISTVEVTEDTSGTILGEGSSYHYATVTVDDSGSGGTGGTVRAIISPSNGHGTNPVEELGAYFVGINSEFRNSTTTDSDIQINTEYRQVGLMENPEVEVSTANSADGLNGNISLFVTLDPSVDSISNLQYIVDANGDKIAWIDGIENLSDTTGGELILRVHRTEDTKHVDFEDTAYSDLYLEGDVSPFATLTSVVNPEYVHFSGNVLFLENRTAVERNENQIEQIRFVVEF